MKIDRKKMINNLMQITPGVESGSCLLGGSDTVVFTKDGIYSYNDVIAVSLPEITGIEGAVKAKEFYKLITKLKGDEIIMVPKKKALVIKCDTLKAKLKLEETSILRYLENLKISELTWNPLEKDFMKMVRLCKLSSSNSLYRGTYVSGKQLCATDSIRIATATLKNTYETFWIDDTIVGELLKVRSIFVEIAVATGWVHFKTEAGAVFSCKTNDASLYKYETLMDIKKSVKKKKGDIECTLPDGFKEAVDRVSILAEDLSGFSVINLTITSTDLIVSAVRSTGEIEETLAWEEELKIKKDIETSADAGFLMEAVAKSADFYITKGKNDLTFFVFNSKKFSLLLGAIQ